MSMQARRCPTAGDRFTRIVPPSQAELFNADTTGQVVHVGMAVVRGKGSLKTPVSQVSSMSASPYPLSMLC